MPSTASGLQSCGKGSSWAFSLVLSILSIVMVLCMFPTLFLFLLIFSAKASLQSRQDVFKNNGANYYQKGPVVRCLTMIKDVDAKSTCYFSACPGP